MTVASETCRIAYTGDGSTTAFPTTFVFEDTTDLVVMLVTIATGVEAVQLLNSQYTVSGGAGANGTVTFITPPSSSYRVVIFRDPPLTQAVDPINGGTLDVDAELEDPLDKLTQIVQRLASQMARCIRQPEGDVDALDPLPSELERVSVYLGFDSDGALTVLAAPTSTSLTTAYTQTLLDDANAAAARTTLGLGTTDDLTVDDITCDDLTATGNVALGNASSDTFSVASKSPSMANKPLFLAIVNGVTANVTGDGTAYDVVFGTKIFDQTSELNSSTGIFTASVTGKYRFSGTITIEGLISGHGTFTVKVVTSNRTHIVWESGSFALGTGGNILGVAYTCLADVDAGDTVKIQIAVSSGTKVVDVTGHASDAYSSFQGELVTA